MVVEPHLYGSRIKKRAADLKFVSLRIQGPNRRFGPLFHLGLGIVSGAENEDSEIFLGNFVCSFDSHILELAPKLLLALVPIFERTLEKSFVGRIRFARGPGCRDPVFDPVFAEILLAN